ncbi:MAG: RsiV family protein [Acinetobacter populi]|jgi:hypothetical protein|uniref:RsiV family protein n=1 Tax=Acinetobacter populi TaxID=1582270 RepID=UPI002352B7DF|nr:RsiV family protein [Acinetobacter populi]MCH4246926.1 RsiV family protein [Acinetobacter populi]
MKTIHSNSVKHQIGLLMLGATIVFTLAGCEKKPEAKIEQNTALETEQNEITPILQAKVENVPVTLPECNGQLCPKISLQHLKSNYPKIDQAVDQYLLNYVKDLVQGFDIDSNGNADKNTNSNANNTAKAKETASPIVEMSEQKNAHSNLQSDVELANPQQDYSELQGYVNKFIKLADEVKSLGSSAQLSLYVKPQVLNPKGPITTVVMNASNYIGGAHGSSAQQYLNFELDSNSLLSLDQIIQNGQRKAFNDLAYAAFEQWIKETQPEMDLKTYQQLWKFTLSENFYLSSNGLILQYGEYDIGPYAVGLPRLVIPYDKLQGILKPQYLPVVADAAVEAGKDKIAQTSTAQINTKTTEK